MAKWLLSFFLLLNFAHAQQIRDIAGESAKVTSVKKERVSKRKIRKSIDIEASLEIVKEELSFLRRAYNNDDAEIRKRLHRNNFFFMSAVTKRFTEELNACPFSTDRALKKCFSYYFRYLAKKARKTRKLDKIQWNSLKLLSTYIQFDKGSFKLIPPKLSKFRQKRSLDRYLPGLAAYMQNINYFKYKRKQDQKEEELNKEVLDTINVYYMRKIKKVGKITEDEYLFANFNRLQIIEMSKLLDKTMNMMTASSGEVLLQHQDFSEFYTQIEEKEQEIDSLILKITTAKDQVARDYFDRQIKTLSKDIIALRKEVSLFDLQDQIDKAKEQKSLLYTSLVSIQQDSDRRDTYLEIKKLDKLIKDKNREIMASSTRVQLTHGDIYKFTMNWLKIELDNRKNMKEKRSQLYKTNTSFGDLVMASYVTGLLDGEVVKAILELPEMHENYVTPLKQVMRIAGSIGRMFLTINPITSPYATLGFVLFDALKNKKKMEREIANEAHLI
jgi:hypothetical protein